MGYDNSFSTEETLLAGMILTAIAFGIYKGIIKEKPSDIKKKDNDSETEKNQNYIIR
jgi:hypothetical protein